MYPRYNTQRIRLSTFLFVGKRVESWFQKAMCHRHRWSWRAFSTSFPPLFNHGFYGRPDFTDITRGNLIFLPWHTCWKVAHKPNQPTYPPHLSQHATYSLWFRKKLIFGSKNRNSRQKSELKTQPFLMGINRLDSIHNQAVATARMIWFNFLALLETVV